MAETVNYDHKEIEPRWQKRWEQDGLYEANIDPQRPKYYALTMLPYPSGDMHIGHWYAMTPSDARARFMRMRGFNVLFPMGFDAFGLPAENAAIRHGIHPKEWTFANVARMRQQLRTMGTMFDWRREAVSADSKYYKWSEWFFSQLYKKGLAYRKMSPVDWCPHCNTTLAREQVWGEDRHCERCGTPVIKKNLEQWFFRITQYAEELLDFSHIDWPERVRTLQQNWIGRSEGASVVFHTEQGDPLEVFTTRPDTLWGATFMVLAPEHPLVKKITTPAQKETVEQYVLQATRQTDIQREAAEKEKTGVFTGGYAINPVNQARIPIWIADYVLMTYGTGAIMAVPAHDERDFAFAIKFGLPIIPVIARSDGLVKSCVLKSEVQEGFEPALRAAAIPFEADQAGWLVTPRLDQVSAYREIARQYLAKDGWIELVGAEWAFIFGDASLEWDSVEADREILQRCQARRPALAGCRTVMEMLWQNEWYRDTLYHDQFGMMIHSGEFSGTPGETAKRQVIDWLEAQGIGKGAINYHLRDWLISRQRYWGAPIPIVYCPTHGAVLVPDDQLPVLLPDDVEWRPTGESPLKLHPTWKKTTCPICGGPAERETDTMDTFMCSSWYHLRYLSPDYDAWPFDPVEYDYWMPVDTYTGGIEHATMHLIYTRFFHKAGRDMGIMKGPEPMIQLRNQGIILGEDSEKMSKSRGNVVAPDDLVERYGADTVRAYLMFFARWDMGGPWNSSGIEGTARWIRRVWALFTETPAAGAPDPQARRSLRRKLHQTLCKVTHDYESFEFNTIISALMELLNEMYRLRDLGVANTPEWQEALDLYLRMMAPSCPHVTEELWMRLGKPYSIHQQAWPQVDEEAAAEAEITLVLQVNGKVRDRIQVPVDITQEQAQAFALASEVVQKHLGGKPPRKVILVPGRLVNIVI
ncbi:MAG: leucine--tRNA ligase [Anaerolineae bacterium UTCFX2]|jgi:leucyl-tRNA synthetase|nr:leucine--tRNA ligase [Anaerolineales bacterium]OQY89726.1 MAG: leucine--tRNA ligase [Anaerolineae bacterium UTCFX2]